MTQKVDKAVDLAARALEFRDTIERHFFDERGILICNVDSRTLQPFKEEDLSDAVVPLSGGSKVGRWAYEDTMFCTGMYLRALVEEYGVTRDKKVKAIADRIFDDLQPLIRENYEIEPGYIGKPWDGRPQRKTTIDQTFFFCFGLFLYAQIADDARKQRAGEIIAANVDWWMKDDYHPLDMARDEPPAFLNPFQSGAVLAHVYLAFLCTGDEKYMNECERLNRVHCADEFQVLRSMNWHPVDEKGLKTRTFAFFHFLLGSSLWLFAGHWTERRAWWQERFVEQWHRDIKLGMCDNGLAHLSVRINLRNGKEVPIRPEEAGFLQYKSFAKLKADNLQHRFWVGAAKSSHISTHIACCGVQLAEAAPWMRPEVEAVVRRVLHAVDLQKCVWLEDPDGTQWPADEQQYTHSLAIRCITPWLITYWMGRRLGMIEG